MKKKSLRTENDIKFFNFPSKRWNNSLGWATNLYLENWIQCINEEISHFYTNSYNIIITTSVMIIKIEQKKTSMVEINKFDKLGLTNCTNDSFQQFHCNN